MKSSATTATTTTGKSSTILSLFKKSKKAASPSPSAFAGSEPPSPTHSSSASSSSSTLDIQLEFDLTSAPFSTYIPAAAPPAYSAAPAPSASFGAEEEDLEVVERDEKGKEVRFDEKELKRQRKAMKLLEDDRRMSEALKGLGF